MVENLDPVSACIAGCRNQLDNLSNKDAQIALKALCGIYNLRVVPAFVPLGTPQATAARVSRVNRNPRAKTISQSPLVKEVKDKIKDLNRQISVKSSILGHKLPLEDELVIQRSQLFRDLKGAQNKTFASVSERRKENDEGSQSSSAF